MALKIKQRAIISDAFIETMIRMYTHWVRTNSDALRLGRGRNLDAVRDTMIRMRPIIERQEGHGERRGLDYEMTRLRALPFTAYDVIEAPGPRGAGVMPFLVATTKHVTMTNHARRSQVMGEMGPYKIHIPFNVLEAGIVSIHLIPVRNMLSMTRHPHHYIRGDHPGYPAVLQYATSNCYGDYSGVLQGLIAYLDIPGLLQQLYGHLSTFGHLPPVPLGNLDFDHDTPEEK